MVQWIVTDIETGRKHEQASNPPSLMMWWHAWISYWRYKLPSMFWNCVILMKTSSDAFVSLISQWRCWKIHRMSKNVCYETWSQSERSRFRHVTKSLTRSIWKTLGPFATASRRTPIHQVSLPVLSHAACASMFTTTTTTTTRDRGDRYGPMEWAQIVPRHCGLNAF